MDRSALIQKALQLQALVETRIVQAHGMTPMFVRAGDYMLPTAEDYEGAYRHRHLRGKTEADFGLPPMHAWRARENTAADTGYYLAATAYKYRCTGSAADLAICRRTFGGLKYTNNRRSLRWISACHGQHSFSYSEIIFSAIPGLINGRGCNIF